MKMILRQQHNRRTQKVILIRAGAITLFIGVLVVFNIFNFNPFSRVAHAVASFLWQSEDALSDTLGSVTIAFRDKAALLKENQRLLGELYKNQSLALSNDALRAELTELKFLLGRTTDRPSILASVLSRPVVSPYDTLIIDIGSDTGVHAGDLALVLRDFVVGYVSRVYGSTSQITLYSSPSEQTNILIGEERIPAVAFGRGGGNFIADVPRDARVHEGDIITLANIDTEVFSVVEAVIEEPENAFQRLMFKNPVNIFNVVWVEIVQSDNVTP